MNHIISIALLIAGVIHLIPVTGLLGVSQLNSLYSVSIDDPNLAILMRHRAILFAILGTFLVYAAFKPSLQTIAIIGGLISTVTFLWLAWSATEYNLRIATVVYADIVAIGSLLLAAILRAFTTSP